MKKYLLLFSFLFQITILSQTLIQTVDLPTGTYWNSGYGMVYENGNYWISSSSTTGRGIFFAVNNSGTLIDTLDINYLTMRESQGLAFDGTNFWYIERKISRCDIFKIDANGNVLDSITSAQIFGGSWYIGGAGWDGTGLWVSIYSPDASAALYKIDVATKTIVDTISVFGLQPQGITVKGDTLFYVMDGFQGDDERVYAVDLATEDTLFSFHVPEQPGVRQNPRGLAWDGANFWLLAEPLNASSGRKLYKYELTGSGSPGINLLTSSLNFGNVMIDSTSTLNIGVQNFGTADLILTQPLISNSVFTMPTTFPITVQPGQTVNLPVNFIPTANVTYNDSILLYHNDINYPYSKVTVTGTGVYTAPYLSFNPASVLFGNKRINSTSYIELTFENDGSEILHVDSVTLNSNSFYFENLITPFNINPLSSYTFRVWFNPALLQSYTDSVTVYSNASNGSVLIAPVSGNAINIDPQLGNIFWQGQIPDNPGTSFQDYTPRSLKKIQDINGDGIKDMIIGTENYWTIAFNGNSSGSADILWKYSTHFGSINTGSVDWEQGIQISSDLNNDGHEDVVIGTGGGNEFVYALNGFTGEVIWEFGSSSTTDDGDIMGLDVKRDFNNDGVPDVLASASGNESTGSGRFSVYLLNGVNGSQIFRIDQSSQQKLKYMVTSTDDGGAFGSRVGTLNEVFGFNQTGSIIWTFQTEGTPWTVKEISNIGGGSGSDVMVGTTTGRIYCLAGNNGAVLWNTNIGNVFIEDLRVVPDVNQSGFPDVLISGINPNIFMLEGSNGSVIWQNNTGGNILGKDVLGDLTADGIPEVGSGSLNDLMHVYNGVNGNMIFQYAFGGGSSSFAAEHVVDLDDIDLNFSSEFVGCSRDGRVICFSGGRDVIPVELASFSANVSENNVYLSWITSTEVNNSGFAIERRSFENEFSQIAFVQGKGTSSEINYYYYSDEELAGGRYFYRLKQIDFDGTFSYSNEIELEVGLPINYSLEQNFPNPFNPSTTIKFALPNQSKVKLVVYNSLGEQLDVLKDDLIESGYHEVVWEASNFASGVYFVRIEANDFVSVKKMLLLK